MGDSGSNGGFESEGRERLADELLERAREAEPGITDDLTGIAAELGGRMHGLEYRLKKKEKISGKIERVRGKRPLLDDHQAADRLADNLRYTYLSDKERHAEDVRRFLEDLRDRGYEFGEEDMENHWYPGGAYKGINMNLVKNGYKFELQFHTPESQEAKDWTHEMYDEVERPDTSASRRAELEKAMVEVSDNVPFPVGIEEIGVLRG